MSDDLSKARKAVQRQRDEADRRTSKAKALAIWYRQQAEANNWRSDVERLVRGEG